MLGLGGAPPCTTFHSRSRGHPTPLPVRPRGSPAPLAVAGLEALGNGACWGDRQLEKTTKQVSSM